MISKKLKQFFDTLSRYGNFYCKVVPRMPEKRELIKFCYPFCGYNWLQYFFTHFVAQLFILQEARYGEYAQNVPIPLIHFLDLIGYQMMKRSKTYISFNKQPMEYNNATL